MQSPRLSLLAASLLGLLHALSFAPLALWWLQLLTMAGLCQLVRMNPARGGRIAFIFCLVSFSAGLSWMFISMNRFGGMPAPLAAAAVVLLSAYLAAYGALAVRLTCHLIRSHQAAGHDWGFALLLSGLWGIGELGKGLLLTGFPWLSNGYAHVDGPFAGLAPWAGVYGIGMMTVLVGALAGRAMYLQLSSRRRTTSARPLPVAISAIALTGVAYAAGLTSFSSPLDKSVTVRLLQGNVEQQLKFDLTRTRQAMRDYVNMVKAGSEQLNVLPETAWTLGFARTPPKILGEIKTHLAKTGGLFATGIPLRQRTDTPVPRVVPTNSVLAIDKTGTIVARYDKRHLVPFGEFVPPGFQWFIDLMKVPLGNFGRGQVDQAFLELPDTRVAFNICYEDLFGEELAAQVRLGANLLINVSNIGWFGQSHALPQHLNISRMRAMELERPMLRSTNTGVSAHIDHRGRVVSQLPVYQAGALVTQPQPTTGLTPFARFGLWAPAGLAMALTLLGIALIRTSRPGHSTAPGN